MNNAKTSTEDRRIRKTKTALKHHLFLLLEEKPITSITVSDLVLATDINRSTFYRYYRDIPDMLHHLEAEILYELKQIFEDNIPMKSHQNRRASYSLELYQNICEHVKEHTDFYYAIIGNRGDIGFLSEIEDLMISYVRTTVWSFYDKSSYLEKYSYAFFSSACINLLKQWVIHGFQETSLEFADILYQFDINITGIFTNTPDECNI